MSPAVFITPSFIDEDVSPCTDVNAA